MLSSWVWSAADCICTSRDGTRQFIWEPHAALVTTLRYSHAISYSRMKQLLGEVFGLEISEGGIANLLTRVKGELEIEVDGILAVLRNARLVCSDETSARVNGKNQWEWVFQNESVCFHIIRPSRGGDVIEAGWETIAHRFGFQTCLVPKRRIQPNHGKSV